MCCRTISDFILFFFPKRNTNPKWWVSNSRSTIRCTYEDCSANTNKYRIEMEIPCLYLVRKSAIDACLRSIAHFRLNNISNHSIQMHSLSIINTIFICASVFFYCIINLSGKKTTISFVHSNVDTAWTSRVRRKKLTNWKNKIVSSKHVHCAIGVRLPANALEYETNFKFYDSSKCYCEVIHIYLW